MIVIVQGTYGMREGKIVRSVTEKDGPISLPAAEEKRLVDLGIAKRVEPKASKPAKPQAKKPETRKKPSVKE